MNTAFAPFAAAASRAAIPELRGYDLLFVLTALAFELLIIAWRPETLVVILGYQAAGTLGRRLVNGAKRVQVMDEEIAVRAQIHTPGDLSAHAGQSELLAWLAPMASGRPQVALTHGEEPARAALAEKIAERFGMTARLPLLNDSVL
jgi:metallo-beta-lactamase family protein